MLGYLQLSEQLQRLHQIGIALSLERNLDHLLEMIVEEARRFTGADGGTLYLVNGDVLEFAIIQTETLDIRMGGSSGTPIVWEPVPLEIDGKPNFAHVSASVALTGKVLNIPDAYEAKDYDFTGTRRFDADIGYRTRSLLVVPMHDHDDAVIGVLQLLNARNSLTGEVVPFDADYEPLVTSLASQAAVAIDNVRLISGMEQLFEAFVRVMASAIDERSPATAGHIERVTDLTMALAGAVNESEEPPFADVHFDEDELNELRIAALVHDVGKVTTPLHIIEKRTKLEGIRDGIDVIEQRFALIKETVRNEYMRKRLQLLEGAQVSAHDDVSGALADLAVAETATLVELEEERNFVVACNAPVEFMPGEDVERLQRIAAKTFVYEGVEHPYLTEDELALLSIQRGNISGAELQTMRDHAAVTMRLLSQIPFTRKLQNVPRYAGGHHEKLDGSGYPLGLRADELPIQTRMLAIADVYEALTADDRSYKDARPSEEALRILGFMVDDGELDPDLVHLFIRSGVYTVFESR